MKVEPEKIELGLIVETLGYFKNNVEIVPIIRVIKPNKTGLSK